MAVWYQQYYAVPTSTDTEKRGQLEFLGVIYDPFPHLIRDALHRFVNIH